MKTEDFLKMLNGIDDSYIYDAGEDLENYRYSVGKAYTVDTKSSFSWKRASVAIVCAASVMLGAFFVVKKFADRNIPYYPGGQSATSDDVSSDSSDASNTSSEPQKPAGEPTFLTCPDGTPVYTSEISEVRTKSKGDGSKEKTGTLAEAEQIAQTGDGLFTVKCDGFVYGYIRQRAVNRIENPELFKDSGNGKDFDYLGEVSDEKHGADMRLTDLIRIKPGDKFGELTVKNAYTIFTGNPKYADTPYVPGAYIADGCIEFDGAIELEGYICVTPMDTSYGATGDMVFFPNGDSSIKLPSVIPQWNRADQKYYAVALSDSKGYFGNLRFGIGNMYKAEWDTSGLKPGDSMVKAKIVLENISYVPPGIKVGWKYDLKSVEVL